MLRYNSALHKATFYAMLFVFLLFFIFGCVNPYKYLPDRPPKTFNDSVNLLNRCIQVMPVDTAEEKIDLVVPQPPDSSEFYRKRADSIAGTKTTVIERLKTQYKDTCRSVIDKFEQGVALGVQIGTAEGISKGESKAADHYKKLISDYNAACQEQVTRIKQGYNLGIIKADQDLRKAQGERDEYKRKMENRGKLNLWLTIAGLLFLIIIILLWKFRRPDKAANTAGNSIWDTIFSTKK